MTIRGHRDASSSCRLFETVHIQVFQIVCREVRECGELLLQGVQVRGDAELHRGGIGWGGAKGGELGPADTMFDTKQQGGWGTGVGYERSDTDLID